MTITWKSCVLEGGDQLEVGFHLWWKGQNKEVFRNSEQIVFESEIQNSDIGHFTYQLIAKIKLEIHWENK